MTKTTLMISCLGISSQVLELMWVFDRKGLYLHICAVLLAVAYFIMIVRFLIWLNGELS